MEHEDHSDDLDEDHEYADDLATAGHLHEYPEDIEWEERDDDLLDDARDDILDIDDHVLERRRLQMCHAKAKDEGQDKRRHDAHHGRHCDGEVGRKSFGTCL